ncbi:MAG: HesA/MoeB/ThiF family protein [Syntrophomonadaceae bacterium]|jgi:molybdopterin/thiamine biosynthesis adenylyltransferase
MFSQPSTENNMLRYSRQMVLDGFGAEGQSKLKKARVLVVGAGGLGSPALFYLAAAGVGTIGIADYDTVSYSNLNRQIVYSTEDIGRNKTDSADERLKYLNPEIEIIKHTLRINNDNVQGILAKYDLVIDAADNFPARYLINDTAYNLKIPVVEGAASGYDGILMTIIPDVTPCYRCLYPSPPDEGVLNSPEETGVLGMLTGIIGTMQAMEAVKLILEIGQIVSGRIITFDALTSSFRNIIWKKRKGCSLCGE